MVARALKLFRTAIGFHDAYVAAPSRKAALQAWGADVDLFARGVAEQVTDLALGEEALAHPGQVFKRARGTQAEHLAALPPDPPKPARRQQREEEKEAAPPPVRRATKRAKPPVPRPDRSDLEAAERAVEEAEGRRAATLRDFAAREARLARERRQAERDLDRELERLARARDKAREAHEEAMRKWRAS
ncbi:MAG: hypothetical protein QHC40_10750 [Sphingobium sp.]|nr:hypothetical protein [Sphingobium sp.]